MANSKKVEPTVFVKMRTSMAGAAFSHAPGQIVEVSESVAAAWIAAGLSVPAPDEETLREQAANDARRLAELEAEVAALGAENAALREELDALTRATDADETSRSDARADPQPA